MHDHLASLTLAPNMQTWKLKKKTRQKPKKNWGIRLTAVLMLVLTVVFAGYSFPAYWNNAANAMRIPDALRMPEESFRLGLDLQGGTHLVYDADMSQISEDERLEALEGVKTVIERRVNAFGVSEPVVQTTTTGGTYRLIIELAGITDVKQAIDQIGKTPVLEFKSPGQELERELTDEEKQKLETLKQEDREAAQAVLKRALGGEDFDVLISEKSVQTLGGSTLSITQDSAQYGDLYKSIKTQNLKAGQISRLTHESEEGISLYRVESTEPAKEFLLSHVLVCFEGKDRCANPIPEIEASIKIQQLKDQATAENFATLEGAEDLGWATADQYVDSFALAASSLEVGQISNVVETNFGLHLIHKRDERTVPSVTIKRILMPLANEFDVVPQASPWLNTALSGKQLKSAAVQFDQQTGAPNVVLNFNTEGSELFGQLTEQYVGQQIAIFLDGQIISAPVVQQAIYGGQAVITGDFSLDEAKALARDLNAGALPVPIQLLSQQTVGPTLGAVSLEKSITAALIGFVLIGIFMVAVYRLSGLIALLALTLFAFMNLAAYKFFGVTLTLAGIAGFVLSIGIAVDANVLIFERLKEEFASGRDFKSALDEAFSRAWAAIRDGNLTTLIAAAVLYWFSSSFIRGFALTLSIGVLLSMFTAIGVSRVYLKNLFGWKWAQRPQLYSIKKSS